MTKIEIEIEPSFYELEQNVNYFLKLRKISNATVNVQPVEYAGKPHFMAVITYEAEVE